MKFVLLQFVLTVRPPSVRLLASASLLCKQTAQARNEEQVDFFSHIPLAGNSVMLNPFTVRHENPFPKKVSTEEILTTMHAPGITSISLKRNSILSILIGGACNESSLLFKRVPRRTNDKRYGITPCLINATINTSTLVGSSSSSSSLN